MSSNLLAVTLAFASALTIAWGTVVRHRIAEAVPETESTLRTAISRPMWWAGLSTSFFAYGLQIAALSFGPLLVVQPVLVMSLMLTLILSAAYEHRMISVSELTWSFILTLSVSVLVFLGRPIGGEPQPHITRWLLPGAIGIALLWATYLWSAAKPKGRTRGFGLGLVTGGIFGFVAVLSKAVADVFTKDGVSGLLTNWELYALVLAAIIGTAIQQLAFNAGALSNTLPAMKIGEPVFAFSLGYVILGEQFSATDWQWAAMAVAFVAMIASSIVLARQGI